MYLNQLNGSHLPECWATLVQTMHLPWVKKVPELPENPDGNRSNQFLMPEKEN